MGTYNGGAYSDPEIDQMIIASSSIIDRAEREKALQAINKKSVDDVVWIPLHYQQDIYAVVKASGVQFTPRPDQWIVAKEIK
jgi:peptide/nickel transport system substrate-binding protein